MTGSEVEKKLNTLNSFFTYITFMQSYIQPKSRAMYDSKLLQVMKTKRMTDDDDQCCQYFTQPNCSILAFMPFHNEEAVRGGEGGRGLEDRMGGLTWTQNGRPPQTPVPSEIW